MKNAVYTVVQNESRLLPVWLKYYSRYFDDIHVFDHNSTDGSVEEAKKKYKFTSHRIENKTRYDSNLMLRNGVEAQHNLFAKHKYDWLVFAEADELIVLNPDKYNNFNDFFKDTKELSITCTGREVLTLDEEKAIDWDKPLLAQRTYWWPHPSYYKTVISQVPLNWVEGFHYTEDIDNYFMEEKGKGGLTKYSGLGEYIKGLGNPDVYMVHLQKIDWDVFCSRGRFKKDKDHFTIGMNEKELIPSKWKKVL